jgi:hypothetical protein
MLLLAHIESSAFGEKRKEKYFFLSFGFVLLYSLLMYINMVRICVIESAHKSQHKRLVMREFFFFFLITAIVCTLYTFQLSLFFFFFSFSSQPTFLSFFPQLGVFFCARSEEISKYTCKRQKRKEK